MERKLLEEKNFKKMLSIILIVFLLSPYFIFNNAEATVTRGEYSTKLFDKHGIEIWAEKIYDESGVSEASIDKSGKGNPRDFQRSNNN